MGCSSSFDAACKTDQFQEWLKQFEVMQLSKNEIRKLFYIFSAVDVDKSGQIALAELLAHIDLERTKFTERIFSIFDEDGSGEIDFREFVLSLWNYCTLTKATLDMFAFDLYDKDGSGELSAKEVTYMLHDIYGKKECKTNYLARTVANDLNAVESSGELFTIEQYRLFVRTHQALLFPAFQMQLALQRKILGVRFWERNAERRLKFSNGKYISVGNFILMNVDAKKKTVLQPDSAIAKAMGGDSHKHDREVGKMMELAGTKAARKKVVEENFTRGASMKITTGAELFSLEQSTLNTSVPLTEQSKKEWLASIITMPALFGASSKNTNSTTGSGAGASVAGGGSGVSSKGKDNSSGNDNGNGTSANASTKGPLSPKTKQIQVGSTKGMIYNPNANNNNNVNNSMNTSSTINHTPPTNGRRKSFSNEEHELNNTVNTSAYTPYNTNTSTTSEAGIATGGAREPIKLKAVATGLAASIKLRTGLSKKDNENTSYANSIVANATTASIAANIAAINASNNSNANGGPAFPNNSSNTNNAVNMNIPSGKIKNSNLTMNAIKHIDHVSAIDAWEKQPMHATTTGTTISTSTSAGITGISTKHSKIIIADKPKTVTVDANAKPDEDKIIIHNYPTSTKSKRAGTGIILDAKISTKETSTKVNGTGTGSGTGAAAVHSSTKVHTHGVSNKFDTIGFSTKGASVKVRPSIDEEDEDSFGAADFAPSTKKSRKGASVAHTGTAYAVSDIYAIIDSGSNGYGAGAGAGSGSGVSTKEGASKKSRRQSVA